MEEKKTRLFLRTAMSEIDFKVVEDFENQLAAFFNAPYAIAVDG